MKKMTRRNFVKAVIVGCTSLTLETAVTSDNLLAGGPGLQAVGHCKKVMIKCISERGWTDDTVLLANSIRAGANTKSKQRSPEWDSKYSAGSCSLVEVESLQGSTTRCLVDAGRSSKFMDRRFKAEGVDKMLKHGEIDFLYITHDHPDHLLGIAAVLKYNPDIRIMIPNTFHPSSVRFIKSGRGASSTLKRTVPHRGELVGLKLGELFKLDDGLLSMGFHIPAMLKSRGEQSLYFNVKDKGYVLYAGCCHQNVITFTDYAVNYLEAAGKLYGLYGGLHLAPLGKLGEKQSRWIQKLGKYGFKKLAVNHCTGVAAVKKMLKMGYPVANGTRSEDSNRVPYIGTGDTIVFD